MENFYHNQQSGQQTPSWFTIVKPLVIGLFLYSSVGIAAQEECPVNCDTNYFSAKLLETNNTNDCTTYKLEVSVDKENKYGLSHLVVQVPCGKVTEASNSRNWPIEKNAKDPKSGLYGLKVDNISGFGDKNKSQSFTLTYTVCGACADGSTPSSFDVVFKAATCSFTQSINLQSPSPTLEATIVTSPILCNGANNGKAEAIASKGTEPYSYLWSNGQTTSSISGLAPGTYSVVITDAAAQTVNLSAEITQPTALSLSGSATTTACNAPTGSISVTVTGGTAPYAYTWNNGRTSQKIDSLSLGLYTVNVTDINGCTASRSFSVYQNTNLSASLTSNALQCHQEGEGTISTTVSGGTAPYNYSWSNGETTQNLSDLNAGRYDVTITDANGCTTKQATYVTIRTMTASVSAKAPLCQGDATGSATLSVLNGTAPYTYNWSNGETSSSVNNLSTGWYFVDITDANGCTTKKAVNIPTPTPLQINYQTSKQSCEADDTSVLVTLSGSGGTMPYTWTVDGQPSATSFEAKAPTSFEIVMTDANGCEAFTVANITSPNNQLTPQATISQPNCQSATGSATISATNAAQPISVLWADGNTDITRNNLAPGTYTVLVTDAIGCSASLTVDITAATSPTVEIVAPTVQDICQTTGNTIEAEAANAVSVTWAIESTNNDWAIVSSNQTLMTYNAGTGLATITVTATDAYGCTDTHSITLSCTQSPTDPNDDGNDDGNDDNDGDGNNNGGGNNGGGNDNQNCTMDDNFSAEMVSTSAITNNKQTYTFRITTDGLSEHELSHLVIGTSGIYTCWAEVDENWAIEKNSTDPKSGVYGIKIDNISGFGQSGSDAFEVTFTLCANSGEALPTNFTVVYKAATCQWTNNETATSTGNIHCHHYPNPFVDNTTIEVKADHSTDMEVSICDMHGKKVATLYKGHATKGVTYKLNFNAKGHNDRLFFYQVVTPKGCKQGKLLRK
jgi:hypothetical protein